MKEKIKIVSEKFDKLLNWSKMAQGINNKLLKFVVNSLEMVDGTLIKLALTMSIERLNPQWQSIVEVYLDAVIADDYDLVATNTANIVNALVDVPIMDEEQEFAVLNAVLVALVRLIPTVQKNVPEPV
jgi:hypothetical protein